MNNYNRDILDCCVDNFFCKYTQKICKTKIFLRRLYFCCQLLYLKKQKYLQKSKLRIQFIKRYRFSKWLVCHFLIGVIILSGCDSGKRKDFLPPAKGQAGEILVFMDSLYWSKSVGQSLRAVLMEAQPTPQPEPLFNLKYVNALQWPELLKEHRNLIFAFTFQSNSLQNRKIEGLFTHDALEKIKSDTSLYFTIRKNLFAKGQKALFIFSQNAKTLAEIITKKKTYLQEFYTQSEKKFVLSKIQSERKSKQVQQILKKNYKLNLPIPEGFQLVKDTLKAGERFLWIRHPEVAFDLNIFIAKKKYTSAKEFEGNYIIEHRNALAKQYLYGDPENKNSFIITETLVEPLFKEMILENQYSIRTEGLWRTNNISMGGPFVSYTLTNPKQTEIYYLEGFAYAPSMRKRELLRKLETILSSVAFTK